MDSNPIESGTECIEVSAVAKILGVSTTTVYNKLSGEWQAYKRKVGSLTMVDLAALTEEQRETAREILSKRTNDVSNGDENDWKRFESVLKDQIEILKRENARLERLLDEANARIGEKDSLLSALTERIAAIAESEQRLTERALQTTGNAQMLQAADRADVIQTEAEPETEEEPEERGWFGLPKRKKKKG